jgi:hypothetical protein
MRERRRVFTKRQIGGKTISGDTIHEYKTFKVYPNQEIELSHSLMYYIPKGIIVMKGNPDNLQLLKDRWDRKKIVLKYIGNEEAEYEIIIY